ncbi:MAG TPA: transcription termination factor NusA [Clostridiaceae bacterium]|nr:transcription termination factor NusA [Clostridiaceae bacterium]
MSEELIFETLEDALIAAYKKNYANSGAQSVRVTIDRETGEIKVFALREVVENVNDHNEEVTLEEAKAINAKYELGDFVEDEVTPMNFARVAAQSAKQIVTQRIKEAERSILYSEYAEKEFDLITGTIQRKDKGNVYIDLGKTETVLGPSEQIPNEAYEFNEKIQLYIVEVKQNPKGPMIAVSRTHPGLVKRLFEREVPEIFDGTVEIKSISREAGSRTKIAVHSNDPEVDPMGACVGPRGTRVQNIVRELRNEKIDIIKWSKDPAEVIAHALSPAKVLDVTIDENTNACKVLVDDSQLSLAIGKEGQNVRLAAKLTGWKIDIKSTKNLEDQARREEEAAASRKLAADEAEAASDAEILETEDVAEAMETEDMESPETAAPEETTEETSPEEEISEETSEDK